MIKFNENIYIMLKFEANKDYGNDLTIKVLSRTEKTITIETTAWGVCRVKVREYQKGIECIYFKAWIITADETFDADEAQRLSFERAYN